MLKGQLAGLMKQAQKMQENMQKLQEELANLTVEGASGGGLVKVTLSCKNDVKRVQIDSSLLSEDKDLLEDLVAAAMNDAVQKAQEISESKTAEITKGMPLPPGMSFPF